MIRSIRIRNFRTYLDKKIDFANGINLIIGVSNSGKSNVLRAIQWVRQNRPLGLKVKNRYAAKKNDVVVEITTTEGSTVKLEKNTDGAIYSLEMNGNVQEFQGMDKAVPIEITKELNLSETNIAEQLDQHFLITSTAGEVARSMNTITHIEDVDKWVKSLTTKINTKTKEIDFISGLIKDNEDKLSDYADLDIMETDVKRLEASEAVYNDLSSTFNALSELIALIENTTTKIEPLRAFIKAKSTVELLSNGIRTYGKLCAEEVVLEAALSTYREMVELQQDIDDFSPHVVAISKVLSEYTILENEVKMIETYIIDIEHTMRKISALNERINDVDKQFRDYLSKVKICPFCKSKMDEAMINTIVEGKHGK
jgi:exonuclease SbcC